MKKYLLLLLLLISVPTFSQTYWFNAYEFAYKLKVGNTWLDWSDWQRVNIDVKIDLNNDRVTIYSKETQIYNILRVMPDPYDAGGETKKYYIIDQDLDYGYLRIRREYKTGVGQLYLDFNDISWTYNIRNR